MQRDACGAAKILNWEEFWIIITYKWNFFVLHVHEVVFSKYVTHKNQRNG